MLLQYFGFEEEPFGATPDPRCIYLSHTHREALASLKYGFHNNRGFTAMIAPPGMGKTTLLRRFLEDIRESARTVFLFDVDSDCEPRDFLAYILRDIGIIPGGSSSEMHEQLSMALVKETRAGRKFVIVIDEAQNLSDAVLERVRLLTNFETSSGKLLQIVLSGQPQLSDKLMQASLVQLRQRVSTVCHIDPLSAEETIAYIDFRLKQAGYSGQQLFTDDALTLIWEASRGTPRIINNLSFNSLSLCRALNKKQVDVSMLSEVIADLQLTPQPREPVELSGVKTHASLGESGNGPRTASPFRDWALVSAALLVMCVLGVFGLMELRSNQPRNLGAEHSLNQSAGPAPTVAGTGDTAIAQSPPGPSFEITVVPDQTLQDIATQYLGGFDSQRLRQIQSLNPNLTDPDFILAGQKIRLPGPPPAANSATLPTHARTHP
jgi:type II secretory pathway predicted ATPase ExeA